MAKAKRKRMDQLVEQSAAMLEKLATGAQRRRAMQLAGELRQYHNRQREQLAAAWYTATTVGESYALDRVVAKLRPIMNG